MGIKILLTPALEQILQLVLCACMCAVSSTDQQGAVETDKVLSASPMMQVESFFKALTNSNTDGRVVVHRHGTIYTAK